MIDKTTFRLSINLENIILKYTYLIDMIYISLKKKIFARELHLERFYLNHFEIFTKYFK